MLNYTKSPYTEGVKYKVQDDEGKMSVVTKISSERTLSMESRLEEFLVVCTVPLQAYYRPL